MKATNDAATQEGRAAAAAKSDGAKTKATFRSPIVFLSRSHFRISGSHLQLRGAIDATVAN